MAPRCFCVNTFFTLSSSMQQPGSAQAYGFALFYFQDIATASSMPQ